MSVISIAIAALFLGVVIGYVIVSAIMRKHLEQIKIDNSILQTKLDTERENAKTEAQKSQQNYENALSEQQKNFDNRISEQKKQYEDRLKEQQKRFEDSSDEQKQQFEQNIKKQQELFDETLSKVQEQMKNAAEAMLKDRQKEFSESSNSTLGQIVNPLKESIEKMKVAMNENVSKQTEMGGELKANIENMLRFSEAARKSADELAQVFKHKTKVQGDWGESILSELLDSQGFVRGVHYDTQVVMRDTDGKVLKSEEGNIMRPDLILHLDQKRDVIIDSKVSLTAFFDYVNAEDEEKRNYYLNAHVESIRNHVKELAAKDYSSYIKPPKMKMDYVIMFVPHTGALWTALNSQKDLWRKAMEKNVFIADEQTLFAALRIINMTWTQIAQAQNHQHVFELVQEMIDRVGQFMKKYQAIGKSLDAAKSAFEDGEKKLLPKGQSIIQTCSKLQKLSVKANDMSSQLIDVDDIPLIGQDSDQIN